MSKKSANDRIAQEAIRFLGTHMLDPTPFNYRFAYIYLTNTGGSLRKVVDEMADGGFRIGQLEVEELMGANDDAPGAAPSGAFDEHQSWLRRQAQSFADLTNQMLSDTGAFNRDLRESVDDLNDGADLITIIGTMMERTADIENKLAETSQETERLRMDLEAAREDASRDGLTNLPNRRAFDKTLQSIMGEAKHISVAFCDIDRFKSINDRFGHAVGDRVLKAVANALSETLNPHMVARYGGEEFVALFQNVDGQAAYDLIEAARAAVSSKHFRVRETDDPLGHITFSAGIATTATDPAQALLEADKALYEAKNNGRDQAVLRR